MIHEIQTGLTVPELPDPSSFFPLCPKSLSCCEPFVSYSCIQPHTTTHVCTGCGSANPAAQHPTVHRGMQGCLWTRGRPQVSP
jgi:hypothetical protein